MQLILLSGGSGKRLWPLSNDVRSKQFIKILKDRDGELESMVQRVYSQIRRMCPDAGVTVATSRSQVSAIHNQIGEEVDVCVEPCRRDTFPAIALAAAYLHDVKGVNEDSPVIVCPVDPYVEDSYFETLKEMSSLTESGRAAIVVMGMEPSYPSDKYGYVIPEDKEHVSRVCSFKEKPDIRTAGEYIAQGALWNAGVFALRIGYILDRARELTGYTLYEDLREHYEELKKISFDYAVAEHEKNIMVVRYSGEWRDVGTWNTMSEVMSGDAMGNVTMDSTCVNTKAVNELEIPLLCMGTKDMIIAASSDGILVSGREASGYMKPFVEKITEGAAVRYADKSWGSYTVIDAEPGSLTVKVVLKAGNSMKYHSHEHRSETWNVLSGKGRAVIDGETIPVSAGSCISLPVGKAHKLCADTDLSVIEVQTGDVMKSDKILRDLK
ncbi:MAG: cupin domain-containing protein [Lachnospiraceae bacterium]|nr:cupin domain-containing protein [Lachnospiraceae bacterium]